MADKGSTKLKMLYIKEYLEKVLTSGVTHHCIVGLTDMSQVLMQVADFLNIETFYIE